MPELNRELRQGERPHRALGCLTPQQFLLRWQSQRKERGVTICRTKSAESKMLTFRVTR